MDISFEKSQLIEQLRSRISEYYLTDETHCIEKLLLKLDEESFASDASEKLAAQLVSRVRDKQKSQSSIEAFIHEYDLSSEEGVVLMCLAEALLRIPDNETADKLIRDKIAPAQWQKHLGHSSSMFVNASTWGLMLTGKLIGPKNLSFDIFSQTLSRIGEPVIRTAMRQAMKLMGSQYVMGTTIDSAVARSKKEFHQNYCFSYDMLGEAALSNDDAERYFDSYQNAIKAMGKYRDSSRSLFHDSSISIKLSALHPRYEILKKAQVMQELLPRIKKLVLLAKSLDVAVTLDAEEADRLELSLDLFHAVLVDNEISSWGGFGLAVQAYQKRAPYVLRWLEALATVLNVKVPVRLVKGAYWDTEIKRAQEQGLSSYPVFTRKINTDLSYLVCAQFMLSRTEQFYPQFATHNAFTLAAVIQMGSDPDKYELQRLHGMGESLFEEVINNVRCRVYAPVGGYNDLLPYLVRRLLENGANTSFVNRIEDESIPVEMVAENPIDKIKAVEKIVNPKIPLPKNLFGAYRENSIGINLFAERELTALANAISEYKVKHWSSMPLICGESYEHEPKAILNPADVHHRVGNVSLADKTLLRKSLKIAHDAKRHWSFTSVEQRVDIVNRFSQLLEKNRHELYALCMFEAGKTIGDSVAELREAVDFCHYYVVQAEKLLSQSTDLPGPTGESNTLSFHPRGVFVCVSPWNFPLAIFTGQIVAALLAGNCVVSKPSSNTPLIAAKVISLLLEAGVPKDVISFVPCSALLASEVLMSSEIVSGVAFTGSYGAAVSINKALAIRDAPLAPLVAETGGLNVMIVDSSSLAEQVVKDVISSAFYSAGQRCSALRVLIIQEEVYTQTVNLLVAAMKTLKIGAPSDFAIDIPPVIDNNAKQKLERYKKMMRDGGKELFELALPAELEGYGSYVSPALYKVDSLNELEGEQFGPLLHVMPYKAAQLDDLLRGINNMGYGLTLGVHSRINATISYIVEHANVGNIYINRNMIGAVVGVQPFGGEGYSGTGPKAGGPNYLQRFCAEKTVTINTAAVGGNAELLAVDDSGD